MSAPIDKIDTTPLVGVALILVIVFMVTSPLLMKQADMELELPKARTIETKSQKNITISIAKDGEVALNEEKIQIGLLFGELKTAIQEAPDRLVVIRADKNVPHENVLSILSVAKKAGAGHLAIATVQRNRQKI